MYSMSGDLDDFSSLQIMIIMWVITLLSKVMSTEEIFNFVKNTEFIKNEIVENINVEYRDGSCT